MSTELKSINTTLRWIALWLFLINLSTCDLSNIAKELHRDADKALKDKPK